MLFANPLMLLVGTGLVALPIVLHLIMQQKPRDLDFPALRFVRERLASNQRRLRVRHWILLLLRCLGLFLIALAFAMPSVESNRFGTWLTLGMLGLVGLLALSVLVATILITRPVNRILVGINGAIFAGAVASMVMIYSAWISDDPTARLGSDQAPITAVVLIDNSPRMLYEFARETGDGTVQAESRLDHARRLADWLIRQLPDESSVAILDATDSEPFFSIDIAAAAKRISALQVSFQTVSLVDRINTALEFLASSEDADPRPQEIYVLSDLTVPGWQSRNRNRLKLQLADRPDVTVYIIDVGVERPANYLLSELELSSQVMSTGGSIRVTGNIVRQGPPGERPVNLYLDIPDPARPYRADGKTVFPEQRLAGTHSATLDENGADRFGFTISGLPLGTHQGEVRIEGADNLKIDNNRYFTIEVREPRKVLILRPETESANPVVAENVAVVLAPDELVQSGEAEFSTTIADQSKILEYRLAEYEAVFLLDPGPLTELEWKTLAKYAEGGGGVAVCLGENARAGFGIAPEFVTSEAKAVLGGELTEVWTPTAAYLSIADYNHPVVQKFKRFETDDVWRDFNVYQHWGMLFDGPEKPEIIARFTTRKPALIENRIGRGTVLVMTTPLTEPGQVIQRRRWNELTTGEWWPAALLIDEMARYLVSSAGNRLNYRIGAGVTLSEPPDSDVTEFLLFSPRDEEPVPARIEGDSIRYRFTDVPGNYRLKPVGNPAYRQGFSVNMDPVQTDLARADEKLLNETLGEDRFKIARTQEEIVRQQSFVREGKKFYPLLLTIFGVIILMEFLMANRFYRGL